MSYEYDTLEIAALGRQLPDGSSLEPKAIFSYLAEQNFGAVIDCSGQEDLETPAALQGLYYENIFGGIPSSVIVKSPLFFDLLTPEQQRAYRVPVLLDHFTLHRLPILLYNTGLKHPGKKIALLFADMHFSSILRLHFSASVGAGDITGIDLQHFFPAYYSSKNNQRQEAEFLPVSNRSLNSEWQQSYDDLSQNTELPGYHTQLPAGYRIVQKNENNYFTDWFNQRQRPVTKPYKAVNIGDQKNVYIMEYVPKNRGGGDFTQTVWRFKSGNKEELKKQKKAFMQSVRERALHFDLVVRALSSNELVPGNSPMDEVGRELESLFGYNYRPDILSKARHIESLKNLGARARKQAIEGVYRANSAEDWNGKRILIIDDVYTTGTTNLEITRALKAAWPNADVYGHFLSRTI